MPNQQRIIETSVDDFTKPGRTNRAVNKTKKNRDRERGSVIPKEPYVRDRNLKSRIYSVLDDDEDF